jgi:hypothetical protein
MTSTTLLVTQNGCWTLAVVQRSAHLTAIRLPKQPKEQT